MNTLTDRRREANFASGSLLRHLNVRKDNAVAQFWDGQMRSVIYDVNRVSLRTWLDNHNGEQIDTLQASVDPGSGDVRTSWLPGRRVVDASHSTWAGFVIPQGGEVSMRHYDGVIGISANDDTWVGYDSNFGTVIVYTVAVRS